MAILLARQSRVGGIIILEVSWQAGEKGQRTARRFATREEAQAFITPRLLGAGDEAPEVYEIRE